MKRREREREPEKEGNLIQGGKEGNLIRGGIDTRQPLRRRWCVRPSMRARHTLCGVAHPCAHASESIPQSQPLTPFPRTRAHTHQHDCAPGSTIMLNCAPRRYTRTRALTHYSPSLACAHARKHTWHAHAETHAGITRHAWALTRGTRSARVQCLGFRV
jgi:hypothetical protein